MNLKKYIIFLVIIIFLVASLFVLKGYKSQEYKTDKKCLVAQNNNENYIVCDFSGSWETFFIKKDVWGKSIQKIDINNYKILTGEEIIKNNLNNLLPHEGGANLHERMKIYLTNGKREKNVGIVADDFGNIILRFRTGFKEYTFLYGVLGESKKIETTKGFYYYVIF